MAIKASKFQVESNKPLRLADLPTSIDPVYGSHSKYEAMLADHIERLAKLQKAHYASEKYALLIIFQAMDAAGKDGSISHVMSGVDPQGVDVYAFKQPTPQELRHDFLWRTTIRLPERGKIAIFNRSYYEEVLVTRVHPEILATEGLPPELADPTKLWANRFKSIVDFEDHLHRNGTKVVKIYLHLSKGEQRKRFLERLEDPDKTWKFSASDLHEREFWDSYISAYEEAISATSTHHNPWFVVPADDKKNARLIVSEIVLEALKAVHPEYPIVSPDRLKELESLKSRLQD